MDTLPLVGIDPDEVHELKLGGATFKVGVVDSGIWARLENEATFAFESAKRRAIARLAGEGADPEEVLSSDAEGNKVTRLIVAAFNEPQYRERLVSLMEEAAKYGVRGHAGFIKRDGSEIPFASETATHEGRTVPVVAPQTLRVYRANPAVLQAVWLAVKKLNSLGSLEKKG